MEEPYIPTTVPLTEAVQMVTPEQAPEPTPPIYVPPARKKFPGLLTLAIILLAFVAAIAVYLFVQVRQLNTQLTATPTPLPTPVASVDPFADWQSINNTGLLYIIKLPSDWKTVEHSSNFSQTYESYESPTGQRIDIVKDKNPKTICRGDCPAMESSETMQIGDYSVIKEEGYIGEIGGNIAHRYITYNIPNGKTSIDITFHPSTTDKESGGEIIPITDKEKLVFDQIISTFKFVDITSENPTYVCPQTSLNCEPGPNTGKILECSSEYLSWAKTNCPNFKGASF